jgi:hypothetical protein
MPDDPTIRITIKPSHRPSVLAAVSIDLHTDLGTIRIHDGRILRNKAGQLWFSLPTFSITVGKSYEYQASLELSGALHRQVSEAALKAYEQSEPGGGR